MVLVVVWVVARIGGWVVAVVVEIRLLLLWVDRYGGLVVVVVVVVVFFFFFFFFLNQSCGGGVLDVDFWVFRDF